MEDDAEAVEPNLEVVLNANGVEVARTADSQIWLQAMAALTKQSIPSVAGIQTDSGRVSNEPMGPPLQSSPGLVGKFAEDLGIPQESLVAGADPSEEAPYVHLDPKYWEAFKRTSGYGRVSPTVLSATLLLLWDRHFKNVGDVTTLECSKVSAGIGLSDKNPTRGINNCDWLQLRGKVIKINPTEISQAEKVVVAYCTARGS
ncbi:hypothetical protein [Altererythrobacter sp. ZODW24]|uniref:hypothetical protein n=1 Tax=Altererythrobacter sp. ZODW24 TaxID=2185142 RepID=UPI000DF7EF5A|nr:hypothetical protein [Altererythrobacter sp. ZODW24]